MDIQCSADYGVLSAQLESGSKGRFYCYGQREHSKQYSVKRVFDERETMMKKKITLGCVLFILMFATACSKETGGQGEGNIADSTGVQKSENTFAPENTEAPKNTEAPTNTLSPTNTSTPINTPTPTPYVLSEAEQKTLEYLVYEAKSKEIHIKGVTEDVLDVLVIPAYIEDKPVTKILKRHLRG